MSFVVKLQDVIVGRSALEERDQARLRARGEFRPGLGYELVEPIFALVAGSGGEAISDEQRQRYRRARDTLALVVYGPGEVLVETSRIDIVADHATPSGLVLDVTVIDPAFWTARA